MSKWRCFGRDRHATYVGIDRASQHDGSVSTPKKGSRAVSLRRMKSLLNVFHLYINLERSTSFILKCRSSETTSTVLLIRNLLHLSTQTGLINLIHLSSVTISALYRIPHFSREKNPPSHLYQHEVLNCILPPSRGVHGCPDSHEQQQQSQQEQPRCPNRYGRRRI